MSDLQQRVFDYLAAHQQSALDRLFAYLRMPSISAHGTGMQQVADFLVAELQRMGMQAQLIASAGWPFVYARRDDQPGAPTVLLYGHYDVQPADPLELWQSPPFEPTIRDGKIYARGAGDNKGQHFAQLLALEALLAVNGSLPCNVIVLLEGEEEVGSPHIAEFVAQHRELLNADLVVTADGPQHESGRPALMFGVRGVASFELRARGASRDLHSGNFGGVAPNPIWTLVHLLATMRSPDGRITIDGFNEPVLPPTPAVAAALAALPLDLEAQLAAIGLTPQTLDAPADRDYYARLSSYPTFTINGLHGGYGGPGSKTVLPAEAVVKCDMRLVPDQTVEQVLAAVEAHVQRHAPQVEFIPLGGMDPSQTPLESRFTEPLRAALAAGQRREPLLVPAMGGSLPEYIWTKVLGVPAFVTPYANHDEANHAPNENIEVELFLAGIRSGVAMMIELGRLRAAG
jgi:acetylornithine deacetylase/succinyl-diaminopimelate desuccinylase-like protein